MLKTKMRKWCLLLLLLGCSMGVQAQYSMGNTGLLNIPTADMQETGTFMGGGNYLPNGMTPFNFNTGNYFVNITFLSFLELSYRCTLQKAKRYDGKEGYFHQDRSMTARVRPLKEGKFHPSLLLGVDDPFKNTGINYFATVYGALTKVSKSLLKNSNFNLTNWVIAKMAKKIAKFLDGVLLNGATSKVNGIALSYDSTKMKKTLASKSSETSDELIDVQELVPDEYQADAIWIMNKKTRTAIRKLKDSDNNYLLNRDLSSKWGYTLLGKDVYCSDNVSELGEVSKNVIFYGDLSGLAVKESETSEIQILNELFAAQHAIGVVAWGEIDAKVEDKQKIAVVTTPAS